MSAQRRSFLCSCGREESVTNKFSAKIFRDPASALSFSAALRNSHGLPAFDPSRLTTNDNSRNAYAYSAGHLCGREESNPRLNVGSVVFYH